MYDLLFYFELGLFHVLDWSAYDHLLFLIALTIPFSFKQVKTVFWIVTFFTLGHSASLFFSAYEIYKPPQEIIEILRQKSRPYLFSNTLAPSIVGASLAVLDILESDNSFLNQLKSNTKIFREGMIH